MEARTVSPARRWYRRALAVGVALALTVIVLGAYVRLSDAGLGCPDWPGCYGHLVLPGDDARRDAAQLLYPERPIEDGKAWREMVHRYLATTLGLSIIAVVVAAWLNRRDPTQPRRVPVALLAVVCFQGLLGMWTVTLLLKPLVVMGHLIGGLTTLAILAWLLLEERRPAARNAVGVPVWPVVVGLAVLAGQIALGGWTSSNYAALACPDVPTCQGQWWPDEANFAEGFVLWRGLGINYEFGVLDAPSRVAIHFVHRLGALTALTVLGAVAWYFGRPRWPAAVRTGAAAVGAAVVLQVAIGVGIVWFGLPLPLATSHNAVAALLLLAVVNLLHATIRSGPAGRRAAA
ncbi:MAG: COX15/CtaA family protein [Chromatiales bacterium]|jgi:cytochrome c oxidase assembly protein subunit 15|nr:COX15/CtaA family protein [Chromatiales bacterium]